MSNLDNPVMRITALSGDGNFIMPIGFGIDTIYIYNNTANAITGGLKIGTSSGAADIIAAQTVGANAKIKVADSAVLKSLFSLTATQTIYIAAVTAWNSANIEVFFIFTNLETSVPVMATETLGA